MRTTISIVNYVWARPYLNLRDFVMDPIYYNTRAKVKAKPLNHIRSIFSAVNNIHRHSYEFCLEQFA